VSQNAARRSKELRGLTQKFDRLSVERLLHAHVVLNGFHAVDFAREGHCPQFFFPCADKATELHNALEGHDFDLEQLELRVAKDGGLDLGGNCRVVNVLARAVVAVSGGTASEGDERSGQHQGIQNFFGLHGGAFIEN